MSIFMAGLDLGQAQDYTALVIMEAHGTWRPIHGRRIECLPMTRMDIRHVERFKLGLKYVDMVRNIEGKMLYVPDPKYIAVDQTGVGNGVIEMLHSMMPLGITITGGDTVRSGDEPRRWHVPKRELVSVLQVGLQNGILKIAKGLPGADLLMKELLAFRAKISASGHDTYEAWREAEHDDLVLAAGIAAWCSRLVIWANAEQRLEELREKVRELDFAENQISPI